MSAAYEPWLRLVRTPGVGPKAAARLLAVFPNPADALAASRRERSRALDDEGLAAALETPDHTGIEADLAWLAAAPDHHLLTLDDPRYPEGLRALTDPPPVLFVTGAPELLRRPQLAVIGSRKPTPGGRDNAVAFAADLTARGLLITSGLALGIDGASHRSALDAGGGTIAVAGTGPDRVYPARHRALARAIAESGAIVSEFPTGVGVRREHFPRRNRLISGLALGVLVVEAGLGSGSLVTARHAVEQGREVFAIPGSIHNPLARGCHALIRQGAKLVESSRDILEELPPLMMEARAVDSGATEVELDADQQSTLDALGYDPETLDTMLHRTGLTPGMLSSMLLRLELMGLVTACPGGRFPRTGR